MAIPYDRNDRFFTLSIFANLITGETGSGEHLTHLFQERLKSALSSFVNELGSWELVWGPAIYQAWPFSNLADNAMQVARHRGTERTEYCIGIAAVNSKSLYDWFVEDLNTGHQTPWWETSHQTADGAKVSQGVDISFMHLVKMTSDQMTLETFLEKHVRAHDRITVAGHSFGGPLAAAVALWLVEQRRAGSSLAPCEIDCRMSGAPTPGNKQFADLYERSGLSPRTTTIENTLDLATDLWSTHDIAAIPRLYSPHIAPSGTVNGLTALLETKSKKAGGYSKIKSGNKVTFHGTYNASVSPATDDDTMRFLAQAHYEHIIGYLLRPHLHKLYEAYIKMQPTGMNLGVDRKDIQRAHDTLVRRLGV